MENYFNKILQEKKSFFNPETKTIPSAPSYVIVL